MLDDANNNFVNGVVTVIRYGVYVWLGILAITAALWAVIGLYGVWTKASTIIGNVLDRSIGRFLP